MYSHQDVDSLTEQKEDKKTAASVFKEIGLTAEASIDSLVKSSNAAVQELGATMHGTSCGKMARQLGPICKLIEVVELKENYDELKEKGHSSTASFLGSAAAVVAESGAVLGGASLATAGIFAGLEFPPLGATAVTGGLLLMRESETIGHVAGYYTPIIVDATLDKFVDLYSSAAQFVKLSYQRFSRNLNYVNRKYDDIESVMLDLGFKEHVRELYQHLDQNQQLIYSTVTRDLFNTYFQLHPNKTISAQAPVKYNSMRHHQTPERVKKDIEKIHGKLIKTADKKAPKKLEKAMKEQNKQLKACLTPLINQANQKHAKLPAFNKQTQDSPVKAAYAFCEGLHAASQGVALFSHVTGNPKIAQQVTMSAAGVSQVVMGIAQIAENGFAAGPIGMVFGGMNMLISCFGSDGVDNGMQAIAEQLVIISKQINALHEDMLFQFGKVFTALGIINTNIIQAFRILHEDQVNLLTNVMKLQKSVFALQDSINVIGHQIDRLGSDLQGYVLEDDRKQLQLALNDTREQLKRPFNRLKLHPKMMAAFRTFNEELIAKKINAEKVLPREVSKNLTTQLGSAEAHTGLLLNYAKNTLGLRVRQPIADPEQWRQTANLLMEMVEKTSDEKNAMGIIGEQDYNDFKYLKTIGNNWLSIVEQFKTGTDKTSKLSELFHQYRLQVKHLIALLAKEIAHTEQETRLKPKFQGYDELKKQEAFKYEFKRNNYYLTATEDWSGCKGFHNAARFIGYDNFSGEWTTHTGNRQKEIGSKLEKYKQELAILMNGYNGHTISYYKQAPLGYCASAFIESETAPETMPLLPLLTVHPHHYLQIPDCYISAEILGIGFIKHTYKFEDNKFIYTIRFHMNGEKAPAIIRQCNIACTLANYLNPAEAAWHAYMGGTYPTTGSYTSLEARSLTSPNGDYYVRHYCALPTIAAHKGLRDTLVFNYKTVKIMAVPSTEKIVEERVKQKKAELRQVMNERIIQQLESNNSRNAIASALTQVDASAKVLIAFLSILFRDKYERPAAIWTGDEILDFAKNYQNQDVYLTHQLEANLDVLDVVEKLLLDQINHQTKSAYTPVRETVKKLTKFMKLYEHYVQDDSVLAAQEKLEKHRDAVLYGASRAALIIQSELLNKGHVDAARDMSNMLAKNGFDILPITQPVRPTPAYSSSGQYRLFGQETNPLPKPKLAEGSTKEISKQFGHGSRVNKKSLLGK